MAQQKRKTSQKTTTVISPSGAIRIEQPKSGRKQKPGVTVTVAKEINPVSGFLGFLREYSVVGVAVGFVIALQAQVVMKQLVASFIDPAFQLLFGGQKLSQRVFVLHFHDRAAEFGWGNFVYILFNFLFMLAAIYIIIKLFALDKLDKPKKDKK